MSLSGEKNEFADGVPFDVAIRVHRALIEFTGDGDWPASEMCDRLDALIAAATAVRAITSCGPEPHVTTEDQMRSTREARRGERDG